MARDVCTGQVFFTETVQDMKFMEVHDMKFMDLFGQPRMGPRIFLGLACRENV